MAKKPIPRAVRRLIMKHLPTVPHLEALMLLHASAPASWSAADLAQRLYVPAAAAREVLGALRRAGLLAGGATAARYWFAPQEAALAAQADQLALLYSSHLVEMSLLIHARLERMAREHRRRAGTDRGP